MVEETSWEFEAIGTHWQISFPSIELKKLSILKERISRRIEEFDITYSRFREDSVIAKMASNAGSYTLPADARPLIEVYEDIYAATDGLVTPLIGQVLADAGYDASYSFSPGSLVTPPAWDEVIEYTFPTLTLKKPALLDFGAAGKGYLVDLVVEILREEGVDKYIVDAGGDMRIQMDEAIRIGLEHPDLLTSVLGIVTLSTGSICGSAGNRRAWKGLHHIMNPRTLTSTNSVKAVWVTASEARVADAVSTCLFFIDAQELKMKLQDTYTFEYVVVYQDYSFSRSLNFPGELFLEEDNV